MAKSTTTKKHTPTAAAAPTNVADTQRQNRSQGMPHALGRSPADMMHMVNDTLTNFISGMGTDKDKLSHTFFGYAAMGREQLDAAYRGDWISRKAIDIPAADGTREWRSWQGDADQITEIEAFEKQVRLQRKVKLVQQWARLYGGAALVLGVDGQGTADKPLDFEKVTQGQLKFVHVVTRWDLSTDGQIEQDLMSEWFGEPKMYRRNIPSGGYIEIHPSRIIRFVGLESPDPIYAEGWGDSVLQVIADAVLAAGTVSQSVAQLVAEAKMDIVKIPGFSEKMASDDYAARVKKRFANANMMKSIFNTLLVDKEEEWDRLSQNFQGMDDILKMYLMIACAAVDVPATRFLSQSPTGMSSTGESDLRNYYDKVATEQDTETSPLLERLDNVMLMSVLGEKPDDLWYEWRPLWQLTPTEAADIAVKKSVVMTADVNAALLNPAVLQNARQNQLIEDGTYPGLETIIDDFGDDIEERQQEEADLAAEQQAQALAATAANSNDPAAVGPDGKPVKAVAGAAAKPGTKLPATKKAVGDARMVVAQSMADRLAGRTNLLDASSPPKPLYIHRDVVNIADIKKWYKAQGLKTVLKDLHVTIIYSKTAVDWLKVGSDWYSGGGDEDGNLVIKPGGARVMQQFGAATVLSFVNNDLIYRHEGIMRNEELGASYDFDDYTPHITITYQTDKPVENIKPYTGKIVLGPEIFEEVVDGGFNPDITMEDAKALGLDED